MSTAKTMYHWTVATPVGGLLLVGDHEGLYRLNFQKGLHPEKPAAEWQSDDKPFREVIRQLKAYFDGKLKRFELPLKPQGTEFQLSVWRALLTIPYGETWSYGQMARHIRRPAAFRAVGAANGQNPIAVIIPCHRVIGADGSLTGFGGGLPIKRQLLALEGALPEARQGKLL